MINQLLALAPEERVMVLETVRHNDIFCEHCGRGSHEHPNDHCQCWNDE